MRLIKFIFPSYFLLKQILLEKH